MKSVLFDTNGKILVKIESNDSTLNTAIYGDLIADITEHPESDMIMQEPEKYKVSKKNNKHEFTRKVDHEKQKGAKNMDEQIPTEQPVEQTQVPVETPQAAPTDAPIETPVAQDTAPVVETAPQDQAPSEVSDGVVV